MFSDPIFINNLIIPIAGMVTGIILGLPVIRAVIRRLEKGPAAATDDGVRELLVDIRERLDAMDARHEQRLVEMEERLDFAERMLIQDRDRKAIGGAE